MLLISKKYILSLKFIYSEKATKFCEISTVDMSYAVTVKSKVEISQNLVAFSEYMNFKDNSWSHVRAIQILILCIRILRTKIDENTRKRLYLVLAQD